MGAFTLATDHHVRRERDEDQAILQMAGLNHHGGQLIQPARKDRDDNPVTNAHMSGGDTNVQVLVALGMHKSVVIPGPRGISGVARVRATALQRRRFEVAYAGRQHQELQGLGHAHHEISTDEQTRVA
ncbi:hypothetical protein EGT09_14920 [Pseudomonas putida]|nr:hypothetical protein EGT09_14920 [Pseudomonas putida]